MTVEKFDSNNSYLEDYYLCYPGDNNRGSPNDCSCNKVSMQEQNIASATEDSMDNISMDSGSQVLDEPFLEGRAKNSFCDRLSYLFCCCFSGTID